MHKYLEFYFLELHKSFRVYLECFHKVLNGDALIGHMTSPYPGRLFCVRSVRSVGDRVVHMAGIGASADNERLLVVSCYLIVYVAHHLDCRLLGVEIERSGVLEILYLQSPLLSCGSYSLLQLIRRNGGVVSAVYVDEETSVVLFADHTADKCGRSEYTILTVNVHESSVHGLSDF